MGPPPWGCEAGARAATSPAARAARSVTQSAQHALHPKWGCTRLMRVYVHFGRPGCFPRQARQYVFRPHYYLNFFGGRTVYVHGGFVISGSSPDRCHQHVWSQLPLVAWVPSCGWMVCYALRPSTRPASSVAPRSRPALAAGAGEKVDAPTRAFSLLRR